jgi:ABC-2 type transport system ATP-binding protein
MRLNAVKGRIWEKSIAKSELEAQLAQHRVISNKLIAGRPVIHVYNETRPDEGFAAVEPTLEDVFFSHINGTAKTVVA